MKSFEEICKKYYRVPIQVHSDLLYILKRKNGLPEQPGRIKDSNYYFSLMSCLREIGAIEDDLTTDKLSAKGKELIKRGYVFEDLHEMEKIEKRKERREKMALAISIIGILTAVAGFFFPIQKDSCASSPAFPEVPEVKPMIIGARIDTSAYMNQIEQAPKDTCKQNCQKNKN